jgi:hypothetical protein
VTAVHRAFDLALATSYIFSGVYPVFLEVRIIVTAPLLRAFAAAI